MSRPVLVIVSLLSCLLSPAVWAAEVPVSPGDGTLAAAVAGASSGDTLVLRDGTYTGDVTVDKSLTVRPTNRGTIAVMVGTLSLTGDGIRVTVQGLKFTQNLILNQAAAVRVLENDFAAGNILLYGKIGSGSADLDAAPAVVIVGNKLASGLIQEVNRYGSGAFYIAGNRLIAGMIYVYTSAWIVGNDVRGSNGFCIFGQGSWMRILANRVRQGYFYGSGIEASSPYTLIAGNVIEMDAGYYGIRSGGSGYGVITNNVIRNSGSASNASYRIYAHNSVTRVSGNIILDFVNSEPINAGGSFNDVSNNLCYHNGADCPAGNGNLNADPKFIDLVDYRLAPNSPAINAGPADYEYADLDRTRNDMGAHGGPWSIGQYDAQRAATNLTPFVYPLNILDIVGGSLEVQALGVARFR
jgi:hypothetical protein